MTDPKSPPRPLMVRWNYIFKLIITLVSTFNAIKISISEKIRSSTSWKELNLLDNYMNDSLYSIIKDKWNNNMWILQPIDNNKNKYYYNSLMEGAVLREFKGLMEIVRAYILD